MKKIIKTEPISKAPRVENEAPETLKSRENKQFYY